MKLHTQKFVRRDVIVIFISGIFLFSIGPLFECFNSDTAAYMTGVSLACLWNVWLRRVMDKWRCEWNAVALTWLRKSNKTDIIEWLEKQEW